MKDGDFHEEIQECVHVNDSDIQSRNTNAVFNENVVLLKENKIRRARQIDPMHEGSSEDDVQEISSTSYSDSSSDSADYDGKEKCGTLFLS